MIALPTCLADKVRSTTKTTERMRSTLYTEIITTLNTTTTRTVSGGVPYTTTETFGFLDDKNMTCVPPSDIDPPPPVPTSEHKPLCGIPRLNSTEYDNVAEDVVAWMKTEMKTCEALPNNTTHQHFVNWLFQTNAPELLPPSSRCDGHNTCSIVTCGQINDKLWNTPKHQLALYALQMIAQINNDFIALHAAYVDAAVSLLAHEFGLVHYFTEHDAHVIEQLQREKREEEAR
ncbi:hypothetical protein EJ08DRAFT_463988 [Tothia fuscella]|uniref:Uncharacterized protein n=1 Tax=Tothia fuscella TaxID=1048955 RepID=A0A9P4TU64_9PEZI|nr:hypothetical protein EJ08DRAFT_463988 [Tothia fuscella]